MLTVTHSTPIDPTSRVRQMAGLFDVALDDRSRFEREFPTPPAADADWNIGLIVGPSGSGKTSLARQLYPEAFARSFAWSASKSLIDDFPSSLSIRDITGLLSRVGFSSPPAWLRPFGCLSNGEQFRVTVARTLAELPTDGSGLAVIDEFTSVVDRTVAKIGSAAVASGVRKSGRKLIAVSCHYDIEAWLRPDWVLDTQHATLRFPNADEPELRDAAAGRSERRPNKPRTDRKRPPVLLDVARVHHSAWKLFGPHHYLSASLNRASHCYLATCRLEPDDEPQPCAFCASLPFPMKRYTARREHRLVCLPDFQGIGIGNRLSALIASLSKAKGERYYSSTGHPGLIASRKRSNEWQQISKPQRSGRGTGSLTGLGRSRSVNRLITSFRYTGPAANDSHVTALRSP